MNFERKKNKMQDVSFKNVDAFLEFLPPNELMITNVLRKLIFDCIPGVHEKLSYNVPFYSKYSGICFIWPSSVLWGKKKSQEGVRLGFQKGYLMPDEFNLLDKGDRKQVYWHDFVSLKEVDINIIRAYLFEAAMIDEQGKKSKK